MALSAIACSTASSMPCADKERSIGSMSGTRRSPLRGRALRRILRVDPRRLRWQLRAGRLAPHRRPVRLPLDRGCQCSRLRPRFRLLRSATGYFQETHPESLFKECSHDCELISGAAPHPGDRHPAGCRQSWGLGRVTSGDVALQSAADARDRRNQRAFFPPCGRTSPRDDVDLLAALLNGNGRVTMLCGSGCQGAHMPQVLALADRAAPSCMRSEARNISNGTTHLTLEWLA